MFLCRRRLQGKLSKRSGNCQSSSPDQQFVSFFSLAVGNIQEDAKHVALDDVRIFALATSGNSEDIVTG
jgi:hypothetical protein